MKKRFYIIVATLWLGFPAEAQVEVITLAESTSGWGGAASLTQDAYEGQFAIAQNIFASGQTLSEFMWVSLRIPKLVCNADEK